MLMIGHARVLNIRRILLEGFTRQYGNLNSLIYIRYKAHASDCHSILIILTYGGPAL